MAISIDWATKIISVPKADTTLIQLSPIEIRELNLNDFRMWLKDLEDSEDGMIFLDTHRHNTEVNVGGITLARVIEIINGYTVTFEDGQYAVNLVGANSNVGDNVNVNQVSVRSFNSAGLISNPAIEYASFNGGVTIDIVNGVSGTLYNRGTPQNPVNNLADALLIAEYRGFDTLYIVKSMTLDSGSNIEEFILVGASLVHTEIIIAASALSSGVTIKNCNINGTLDGNTHIDHCSVGDLVYVNGQIHGCGLYGTITLGGNDKAVVADCYTIDQDNPLIIDMGGSGQSLEMPNYSGLATIKNLTSGIEEIGIGLNAGMIILDSTITAGTIIISGNGRCENNTTGTATVNVDGLMSKETLTQVAWDAVYIDTVNGTSGTSFPIGHRTKPSNNIADSLTIAVANDIRIFKIRGSITLPQAFTGWTFIGEGSIFNDIISLNGQSLNSCRFEQVTTTGTMTAVDVQFVSCSVVDVSGMDALLIDSVIQGTIVMGGVGSKLVAQNLGVRGSSVGTPCIVNMVGTGRIFQANMEGAVQFSNIVAGSVVEIGLNNGTIILDPTCIGGTGIFTGVGDLINYSSVTVTNGLLTESSITTAVWSDSDAESILYGGVVVIDTVNGQAGTTSPIGTYGTPSNNLTDALVIASARKIKRILLESDLTVTTSHNIDDFAVETYGGAVGVDVILETGCSANDTVFRYLNLSGTITNGDILLLEACSITQLYNFTGFMNVVSFAQGAELSAGQWANLLDCHAGGSAGNEPEVIIGNAPVVFNKWTGNLKLLGKTGTDNTVVNMQSGNLIIDSTCTAGKIQVIGTGQLEADNSSAGCQVDIDALISNENIADAVLNESIAEHLNSGSLGESIFKILGLSQENIGMDQHVYITYKDVQLLTSARIRVYSNADSAAALADIDIIVTYLVTATWEGNKLLTYTVVKQ
jgi:hypothetical protein